MPVACSDYREAQLLLALKRRLAEASLAPGERKELEAEVRRLEEKLKM